MMARVSRASLLLLAASIAAPPVVGCDDDTVEVSSVPVDRGAETPVDIGTAPARARRRMDIEQLDRSIRRVTGGIGWEERDGDNLFEQYAETLGVPDFAQNTVEDRDVSVLFLKFVDDAARSVCARLMEREAAGTEERTFLVHAGPEDALPASREAIDQNLAYVLLRFHGRMVDPSSPELDRWRALFEETATDPDTSEPAPMRGWETVCVALIDHPDFYTY